jgi:hypothetical protein
MASYVFEHTICATDPAFQMCGSSQTLAADFIHFARYSRPVQLEIRAFVFVFVFVFVFAFAFAFVFVFVFAFVFVFVFVFSYGHVKANRCVAVHNSS